MLVVGFMGAVSLWTPLLDPAIAARWFTWPNLAYLSPVPIAVAVASLALYRGIRGRAELSPVILAYTAYSYWVFRGKVADEAGYH